MAAPTDSGVCAETGVGSTVWANTFPAQSTLPVARQAARRFKTWEMRAGITEYKEERRKAVLLVKIPLQSELTQRMSGRADSPWRSSRN